MAPAPSAVVDLRTRRIPNWLTLGLTGCGLALAAFQVSGLSVMSALAGFGIGLLLMLPGHVVGATGAGDVKLFAAIGTVLGPSGIAVAFFYTTIVGGVLALVVAINRRRLRDNRRTDRGARQHRRRERGRDRGRRRRQPLRLRPGDRAGHAGSGARAVTMTDLSTSSSGSTSGRHLRDLWLA